MFEAPDVASSTDEYASRFAGPAGEYLLEIQNRAVMRLAHEWRGASVLDVGGGHAQLCGVFLEADCAVTVLGSQSRCFTRLQRYFGDRVTCVAADLLDPPFADRAFELVVAVRMLAHVDDPARFIAGLCRVARNAVIVDYPEVRSVNALMPVFYGLKHRLEGNTRPYRTYHRRELLHLFAGNGFRKAIAAGQFFWPLFLHRKLGNSTLSRMLEALPHALTLNQLFGSPVVLCMMRS
jgi:SAM-dependent methyltransferase